MNYLSKEELSKWLSYNPITGEFRWIKSNSDKIKIGMVAGSKKIAKNNKGDEVKKGVIIKINGDDYSAGIIAHVIMTERQPDGVVIHLNYDRWDLRWDNLKDVVLGESRRRARRISEEDYLVTLVGFNGDYGKREKFISEEVLTYDRLKELIDYDPETGVITSKYSTSKMDKGCQMGSFEAYGSGNTHVKGTRHRVRITLMGRSYSAHRLVWFWMTGDWPDGVIDHIDGDPWNNKWDNLRDVTGSENSKNIGLSRKNKSGVLGVYWDKRIDMWCSQIGLNGRNKNLGTFHNFDDAVKVRKEAEKKYNFHPNHGERFVS